MPEEPRHPLLDRMAIRGLEVTFDPEAMRWRVCDPDGETLSTHATETEAEEAAVHHALVHHDEAAIAVFGNRGALRYVRRVR
jgi:hypothetical protein